MYLQGNAFAVKLMSFTISKHSYWFALHHTAPDCTRLHLWWILNGRWDLNISPCNLQTSTSYPAPCTSHHLTVLPRLLLWSGEWGEEGRREEEKSGQEEEEGKDEKRERKIWREGRRRKEGKMRKKGRICKEGRRSIYRREMRREEGKYLNGGKEVGE